MLCSHSRWSFLPSRQKNGIFSGSNSISSCIQLQPYLPEAHGDCQVSCPPRAAHSTLYSTFHSPSGLSKTLRQDLACSSPCEQLFLPVHLLNLEKQAQLKALPLGTLTCFFPCLSHAQLLSLTSISCVSYSWRWFYHTLDFLPFTQALFHIRVVFNTAVKTAASQKDTFHLTRKSQVKDPCSRHKSLAVSF